MPLRKRHRPVGTDGLVPWCDAFVGGLEQLAEQQRLLHAITMFSFVGVKAAASNARPDVRPSIPPNREVGP